MDGKIKKNLVLITMETSCCHIFNCYCYVCIASYYFL